MDTVISLYYDGTMTEEEKENIRKDIEKLNASILRRKKLLSNENYTSKAPSHVVENDRRNLEKEENDLRLLKEKLGE